MGPRVIVVGGSLMMLGLLSILFTLLFQGALPPQEIPLVFGLFFLSASLTLFVGGVIVTWPNVKSMLLAAAIAFAMGWFVRDSWFVWLSVSLSAGFAATWLVMLVLPFIKGHTRHK